MNLPDDTIEITLEPFDDLPHFKEEKALFHVYCHVFIVRNEPSKKWVAKKENVKKSSFSESFIFRQENNKCMPIGGSHAIST